MRSRAKGGREGDMEGVDAVLTEDGKRTHGGAGDVVLADEVRLGLVEAALQVVRHLDAETDGGSG